MKIKKSIPKFLLFLEFSNPLKQTKDQFFKALKTLFETWNKTLENGRILLLEVLTKTNLKWGIYNPHKNSARWQLTRPRMAFRSTGQRSNFWSLSLPVDRVLNQRATALWPVDRPVDRGNPRVGCFQSVDRSVDRPKGLACVHILVHVGRPVRSTDSGSGRPPEPGRQY